MNRLLSLVALPAISMSAHAGDDCSIRDPDVEDPREMVVQWALGSSELDPPTLEIYVSSIPGQEIVVEFTASFDDIRTSWSYGPWTVDPLDVVLQPVDVPIEACFSPEQEWRLGTLGVEVYAYVEGTPVHVSSTAPLRTAFPFGSRLPMFMDDALTGVLAPGGVLLSSPHAALGPWEGTEPLAPTVEDVVQNNGMAGP